MAQELILRQLEREPLTAPELFARINARKQHMNIQALYRSLTKLVKYEFIYYKTVWINRIKVRKFYVKR